MALQVNCWQIEFSSTKYAPRHCLRRKSVHKVPYWTNKDPSKCGKVHLSLPPGDRSPRPNIASIRWPSFWCFCWCWLLRPVPSNHGARPHVSPITVRFPNMLCWLSSLLVQQAPIRHCFEHLWKWTHGVIRISLSASAPPLHPWRHYHHLSSSIQLFSHPTSRTWWHRHYTPAQISRARRQSRMFRGCPRPPKGLLSYPPCEH